MMGRHISIIHEEESYDEEDARSHGVSEHPPEAANMLAAPHPDDSTLPPPPLSLAAHHRSEATDDGGGGSIDETRAGGGSADIRRSCCRPKSRVAHALVIKKWMNEHVQVRHALGVLLDPPAGLTSIEAALRVKDGGRTLALDAGCTVRERALGALFNGVCPLAHVRLGKCAIQLPADVGERVARLEPVPVTLSCDTLDADLLEARARDGAPQIYARLTPRGPDRSACVSRYRARRCRTRCRCATSRRSERISSAARRRRPPPRTAAAAGPTRWRPAALRRRRARTSVSRASTLKAAVRGVSGMRSRCSRSSSR